MYETAQVRGRGITTDKQMSRTNSKADKLGRAVEKETKRYGQEMMYNSRNNKFRNRGETLRMLNCRARGGKGKGRIGETSETTRDAGSWVQSGR